jgi:type IV pilus assembly protein PilQ
VGGGTSAAGSVTSPPGIGVLGVSPSNTGLNLSSILPVSPTTGLPTGGSLVNLLPLSTLGAFGSPTLGLGFGIIDSRFNIDLALQALQTESKTRTLSRPEIVMVENKEATIALGEQIPYATVSSAGTQIQFVSALLQLTVRPHVILERDGTKVKLKVVVDNNQRGDPVNLGGSGNPPAINTEHAETEVLIKEGERLVIGGVGKTSDIDSVRKVPLFADIPLLGWLFKSKGIDQTSRELVVFITPSVLRTALPTPAPAQ